MKDEIDDVFSKIQSFKERIAGFLKNGLVEYLGEESESEYEDPPE